MTGARVAGLRNEQHRAAGVALCLASAAAFGALPIFGKVAYDHDVNVPTLLFVRFGLAAAAFWLLVRVAQPGAARLPHRVLARGLGMGLVGYSIQSSLYFLALTRIDAGLTALLLYAYPALVTLGAHLLGRERAGRVLVVALALASAGLVLVLGEGLGDDVDGLGVVLGLGAAVAYTGYVLAGDAAVATTSPLVLSALVATGGATSFGVVGAVTGRLDLAVDGIAWAAMAGSALLSTVVAVLGFFAGMARVGAPTASILSTVEPAVSVALGAVVLGEALGPVQGAGAALLLAGVVLSQRARRA